MAEGGEAPDLYNAPPEDKPEVDWQALEKWFLVNTDQGRAPTRDYFERMLNIPKKLKRKLQPHLGYGIEPWRVGAPPPLWFESMLEEDPMASHLYKQLQEKMLSPMRALGSFEQVGNVETPEETAMICAANMHLRIFAFVEKRMK
ncbi:DNA/RNA-binding 3-helical bundle motif protein [Ranid herpesvirus 3]|uniref:DNA/RNA-binding 3-helical bundle motif protein n=1 Tax=Ranid herpesvirus 3 TaxID=1987509 RepID=A0A1X9T5J0_9VIRU|nr:DNA/RNA-binding 3-helical bundle motif protein [Ranid herpesvirus 3]ARR28972.1 DNA/RNA-binding 3-helical bundle motif protein [Ranid herpesvirus 3]